MTLPADLSNDEPGHVPKATWTIPVGIRSGHHRVLGLLLLINRKVRRRYAGQSVPSRGEVREIEIERLFFDTSFNPGTLELTKKGGWVRQGGWSDARNRWCSREATGSLLKEHDVALFRSCPDRGHEPSFRS